MSIKPTGQFCINCKNPSIAGKTCIRCITLNPLLPEQLICVCNYKQEIISKVVGTFKYVGVKNLAGVCAQIIFDYLTKSLSLTEMNRIRQGFCLTYVPMHKNKQIARGFNQSQLIAESLGQKLDMPVINLLQKVRKTKAQMSLNREQRNTNVQNAFTAFDCADKNVLLLDDVITTGSTMQECAKELKKSGALEVIGLAFAKD